MPSSMFKAFFALTFCMILAIWGVYIFAGITAISTLDTYCEGKNAAQCLGKAARDFDKELNHE